MEGRLQERHDEAIEKIKKELGADHVAQIDELTDTLDQACAGNLKKFKKATTL